MDNSLFESNKERCGTILAISVNVIYHLASLLYPYMPSTSEAILKQLFAPVIFLTFPPLFYLFFLFVSISKIIFFLFSFFYQLRKISEEFTMDILPGHAIGTPTHLFSRIEEKDAEKQKEKYKGKSGEPDPKKLKKQKMKQQKQANSEEQTPAK